jgi:hypothetical protein
MQNMSPEERAQFAQRMRERGYDVGQNGNDGSPRPPKAAAPAPRPSLNAGAQTIDQLFGPLPPTESTGRVWTYSNKQLKPIRLRLGVSDGTWTELLNNELQPGTDLVTGVVLDQPAAAGAGGPRSPLMPGQRPPNMGGQRNAPSGGNQRR